MARLKSAPRNLAFVDRHELWTPEQRRAAAAVEREIKRRKLEVVRFAFVDQHGVLRGKTLVAAVAARAMRAGVAMTSTLLAKDTSHRTVFPVFAAGGGMGLDEMAGAGNFIMIADPATFRVLPWANATGWLLCDIYFPNGKPVPFSTRALYRDALARLGAMGFDYFAGLEVEFQLFKLVDPQLATETLTWPAEAPLVCHTTQGFQYLTEQRFDQVDPILEVLRKTVQALELPLRSLEVELGPSQYEFTFAPQVGMAPADTMVLFRSALKQVARRHGHLVSFMCRPRLPNAFASGWHLHQSLLDAKSKRNLFVSNDPAELLSPLGRCYLAGLLKHARAAAAFTTPTVNGYKRYHGVNSMAPIQAIWAHDNRGAMVRVLGAPGDPATHLENRAGEPLANPYLYMASQIHSGLDGIARRLAPGSSADAPYEVSAEPLPQSLAEALAALKGSACFRTGFGDAFVDYYLCIKAAEIARCEAESGGQANNAADVTAWKHKEYFDLA
ncbi:MAG: glutamine synthetase family protein [Xanthobacteraceae bacterium]